MKKKRNKGKKKKRTQGRCVLCEGEKKKVVSLVRAPALSSVPQRHVTCIFLPPSMCLPFSLTPFSPFTHPLLLSLFIPRPAFSAIHPRCSSSKHSSLSFLCASHLSYPTSHCANIFPRNPPIVIPALTCHSHSSTPGEISRQESWSRES